MVSFLYINTLLIKPNPSFENIRMQRGMIRHDAVDRVSPLWLANNELETDCWNDNATAVRCSATTRSNIIFIIWLVCPLNAFPHLLASNS